jgi:hypothetical protein
LRFEAAAPLGAFNPVKGVRMLGYLLIKDVKINRSSFCKTPQTDRQHNGTAFSFFWPA